MTDTPNASVICWRCGTASTQRRGAHPWCEPCGIWLVLDPASGQWVSFAEREHRQRRAADAVAVAASATAVIDVLPRLRTLVPPGWRISAHQSAPDAPHGIALAPPPASPVDVTAYLWPLNGTLGWHVNVHNRTRRIGYPLFEGGGVRAASYTTAEDALHAAIVAVRIDLADTTIPTA